MSNRLNFLIMVHTSRNGLTDGLLLLINIFSIPIEIHAIVVMTAHLSTQNNHKSMSAISLIKRLKNQTSHLKLNR